MLTTPHPDAHSRLLYPGLVFGNEAIQIRMREAGSKSYIRTKIVTLKVQLAQGEKVQPEHLA